MSRVRNTIHVYLDEGITLAHHCRHIAADPSGERRHSWRIEGLTGDDFYFTGTASQLQALGQHLVKVADNTTKGRKR